MGNASKPPSPAGTRVVSTMETLRKGTFCPALPPGGHRPPQHLEINHPSSTKLQIFRRRLRPSKPVLPRDAEDPPSRRRRAALCLNGQHCSNVGEVI